ncbi:MAG: hypothetical protein AB1646_26300 [Thermodesulfobacteriota bacterium]
MLKPTRPVNNQNALPQLDRRSHAGTGSDREETTEQTGLFSVEGESVDLFGYGSVPALDQEATNRFQTRLQKGKVKLCANCNEVMVKSSRMVLSPFAGIVLTLLGASFLVGYGFAVNFLQTPWYVKFSLPAMYYVGAIFIGVGILFFFIREKVWFCQGCKDVRKRR